MLQDNRPLPSHSLLFCCRRQLARSASYPSTRSRLSCELTPNPLGNTFLLHYIVLDQVPAIQGPRATGTAARGDDADEQVAILPAIALLPAGTPPAAGLCVPGGTRVEREPQHPPTIVPPLLLALDRDPQEDTCLASARKAQKP